MAIFTKNYTLTLKQAVAIEADTKEEAERIFNELEHGEYSWYYINNEVYDRMTDYAADNRRIMVGLIEADDDVCRDDDFDGGYIRNNFYENYILDYKYYM